MTGHDDPQRRIRRSALLLGLAALGVYMAYFLLILGRSGH